ncbi:hypothetical protein EJD96_20825 [Herbaspirillum seropedicae]|uniref:hypothetical protein n=1 Tax=Herbaspirillum seropedicae TaxID=964 RepID=UPI001122555D|nr:hypothetical protein [Herbaspirillum seropedicae]QDD66433.1 hypothetical protein EJD96_20825 [Herbaspirillum seropedicae]
MRSSFGAPTFRYIFSENYFLVTSDETVRAAWSQSLSGKGFSADCTDATAGRQDPPRRNWQM